MGRVPSFPKFFSVSIPTRASALALPAPAACIPATAMLWTEGKEPDSAKHRREWVPINGGDCRSYPCSIEKRCHASRELMGKCLVSWLCGTADLIGSDSGHDNSLRQ